MKGPIIVALVALSITACKKQEVTNLQTNHSQTNTSLQQSDYFYTLKVGNYWVYDWVTQKPDGSETYFTTDSIYVEKDTVINNNTYYKINVTYIGNQHSSHFGKADIGYFRTENGNVWQYSPSNSQELPWAVPVLCNDTICNIDTLPEPSTGLTAMLVSSYSIKHKDSLVTVPAGSFRTIDYQYVVTALDPNYPFDKNKTGHNIYGKNMGEIVKTCWYFMNPADVFVKRLVKYKA